MAIRLDHSPISRISLFALALALSGCATVFHGPRQKVQIFTEPEGASATVEGQTVTTPGVLVLSRKARNVEIRIEKEGYTPRTFVLSRGTSKAVWWNFVGIAGGATAGALIGDATSNKTGWFGDPNAWDGALLGALAGPAAGFGLDYATGAAYRLEPARVVVKLTPAAVAEASRKERETP